MAHGAGQMKIPFQRGSCTRQMSSSNGRRASLCSQLVFSSPPVSTIQILIPRNLSTTSLLKILQIQKIPKKKRKALQSFSLCDHKGLGAAKAPIAHPHSRGRVCRNLLSTLDATETVRCPLWGLGGGGWCDLPRAVVRLPVVVGSRD